MIHAIIAMAATAIAYSVDLHVYASLAVACFYVGREHAQAEQRVISKHYGNKRADTPWWCGFERRAWTVKGVMDWLVPVGIFLIACIILV